jgi:hypothetical protein
MLHPVRQTGEISHAGCDVSVIHPEMPQAGRGGSGVDDIMLSGKRR